MVRRWMAGAGALVLAVEALGAVFVNGVLATVVDHQRMTLAGVDAGGLYAGTWAMGVVFALYLLACAVVLVRTALRDRSPGRAGRLALIACAVVHGVLGALAVGLVGWEAFAVMMAVLGLVVLALVAYEPEDAAGAEGVAGSEGAEATGPERASDGAAHA